jgi:hypothetical protein
MSAFHPSPIQEAVLITVACNGLLFDRTVPMRPQRFDL